MKRRVLQSLFVFGVVLTAAGAALWITGQFGVTHIPIALARTNATTLFTHRVDLSSGAWLLAWEGVRIEHDLDALSLDPASQRWQFSINRNWIPGRFTASRRADAPLLERMGFTFEFNPMPARADRRLAGYVIAIPIWFVLLIGVIATVVPGRSLWRTRRRRRRALMGLCLTCGYDLSGMKHERCPECGETVAAAARV